MTVEWFLIALPVVFLAGWFAARLDIRHIRKTAGELPRAYLRGLSHLLRDEKNLALDWFLRALPLDPESVELQFAIGELSRTRGEHRRALKVHLALCARESLSPEDRMRARWELACDYFQMGFFDLAEKHAEEPARADAYSERARAMILDIRQRASDFEGALAALDGMPSEAALLRRKTRAHILCECALRAGDDIRKSQLLEEALKTDGACVRASILIGDMAMKQNDFSRAAERYAAAERQNPEYLWLALPGLMAAHEEQKKTDKGRSLAMAWLDNFPSAALFETAYRELAARGQADGMAEEAVRRGRWPAAAAAWAGEAREKADGKTREFWQALERTLAPPVCWRCESCGYRADNFAWQCHNCLSCESFKRTEDA